MSVINIAHVSFVPSGFVLRTSHRQSCRDVAATGTGMNGNVSTPLTVFIRSARILMHVFVVECSRTNCND
jgi:hypothetical protein